MKNLIVASFGLVFFACAAARDKKALEEDTLSFESQEDSALFSEIDAMFKTVEAKVIYEPFVNKAGKLIEGVGDYFLVYDNQNWFIKFSAGSVLREDIAKLKDQTATFSLAEMEGLWDTDDPNVQSRIGKYVIIYEIVK
ncbi:MAG: hypothetical protein HYZ14_00745 [Bacteroidetes bacterium]|nr:hypothetical protein [Bacteroidota bacterium]